MKLLGRHKNIRYLKVFINERFIKYIHQLQSFCYLDASLPKVIDHNEKYKSVMSISGGV
jgi:hypothetical protein